MPIGMPKDMFSIDCADCGRNVLTSYVVEVGPLRSPRLVCLDCQEESY